MASRTILVVDDDADVREAMAIVLRAEGFFVEQARDGREALAVLRAHHEDVQVVLLDLSMPGMDGHSFLKAKCADPDIENVPVVVVSANSASGELLPAQGVGQYLSKPFSAAVLLQAVSRTNPAPPAS